MPVVIWASLTCLGAALLILWLALIVLDLLSVLPLILVSIAVRVLVSNNGHGVSTLQHHQRATWFSLSELTENQVILGTSDSLSH